MAIAPCVMSGCDTGVLSRRVCIRRAPCRGALPPSPSPS
eukprot:gene9816-biopygen1918